MLNYLLIGGTGSLGNALVKELLGLHRDGNCKICIYSRDEHKQETMQRKFNDDRLRFFIGDIRDKERLALAMCDVHSIINAAALKIVPTAEYNPFEVLKTNTLGVQNLIDNAINGRMWPRIIQISTDKAVKPINLYGATKLCAEKLILAANNIKGENGPKFSIVRYGNVAGSNGSVIPLFKKQLENNEPLTITDERMTRFWITLEDAAKFVLECLHSDMKGGEVFIPKMSSFKVWDLAIIMNGTRYPDYNQCRETIKKIGIRPGEKLHESITDELSSDINDNWLDVAQLQASLIQLGVI